MNPLAAIPDRRPAHEGRHRRRSMALGSRMSSRLEGLDDDALALAVARHGSPAFEVLYTRFAPGLYRYCCSTLRDAVEAEDVVQETMARAYRALCRRHESVAVRPWLFAVARNACIDRMRSRGREADGDLASVVESVPCAQTSLEARERLRLLLSDLGSLSEAQRSALSMRELAGLSHEEIGRALGTTAPRVKALISEARRALADRALGREMPCEELRETLTARGRRALRGRTIRAHVEDCDRCTRFVEETAEDRSLAAFAPALPGGLAAHSATAAICGGGLGTVGGAGSALSVLGASNLAAVVAVIGAAGALVVGSTAGGSPSGNTPTAATGAVAAIPALQGTVRSPGPDAAHSPRTVPADEPSQLDPGTPHDATSRTGAVADLGEAPTPPDWPASRGADPGTGHQAASPAADGPDLAALADSLPQGDMRRVEQLWSTASAQPDPSSGALERVAGLTDSPGALAPRIHDRALASTGVREQLRGIAAAGAGSLPPIR